MYKAGYSQDLKGDDGMGDNWGQHALYRDRGRQCGPQQLSGVGGGREDGDKGAGLEWEECSWRRGTSL